MMRTVSETDLRPQAPLDSWRARRQREAGSSLILALVFLVVVSLLAVALVQWAGNDLVATQQFTAAHALEAAANGSNTVATQYVQYNFIASSLFASPPSPCWSVSNTSTFSLSLNGPTVESWCSTVATPGSRSSRVVTISTCAATITSGALCAAKPLLQSIVTIDDVNPTSGIFSCSPTTSLVPQSATTCGRHLSINSWVFGASPPTLTSITAGSAVCGVGSVSWIVSGSGIGLTTNVYFILESNGTPSSSEVFSSKSFTVNSSTSLNVCTPSISLGTGSAYIIVQTPTGTNAFGPGSPVVTL